MQTLKTTRVRSCLSTLRFATFLALSALSLDGCVSAPRAANAPEPMRKVAGEVEDHFAHLPVGGRKSLHGMVLVGAGPYFLEHIPMLSAPHDFQIIAEVTLKDAKGKEVKRDFSKKGFTLKPGSNFGLNDYLAGRLKSFTGSVHEGSFEQGGKVLKGLEAVQVEVVALKHARQLPAASSEESFFYNDGASEFISNVITDQRNVQAITNKTTGARLWCVTGPDFFDPCP
jgi:hypothetical protein